MSSSEPAITMNSLGQREAAFRKPSVFERHSATNKDRASTMNQQHPLPKTGRGHAALARIAMLAAGLCVASAASAANCSDPPVNGAKYFVVNKDSGLQLDVQQFSSANGATVYQWQGTGNVNQQWTLNELNKGVWTMV